MEVGQLVGSNPGTFLQIWLELRKKRRGEIKGEGRQKQHPEAEGVFVSPC